jgi:Holliday junction DNA helicase RuvA
MISYLRGQLIEVGTESVVIDVQGVGYEVTCNLSTLSDVQNQMGETVVFWIYTHVREDILQLFGFPNVNEKQFFLSLLKVNGIGPKMAINLMSGASVEAIIGMIENEDVKSISKLPKVGKKTAEQLILTLKGKLVITPDEKKLKKADKASQKPSELESALVNLGFRSQDVQLVVSQLPSHLSFEEGLRQGLAVLSGGL